MHVAAKSERVETELDGFIASRDRKRRKEEGERPAEELYLENTRRYQERQLRREWWEHLRYHEAQIRRLSDTLEALVARHRTEAERYAALLGVEPIDETAKVNGHRRGEAA